MYDFLAQDWVVSLCKNLFWLFTAYHIFIVVLWYFRKELYIKLWKRNNKAQGFFIISCFFWFWFWLFEVLQHMNPDGPIVSPWAVLILLILTCLITTVKVLKRFRENIPGTF